MEVRIEWLRPREIEQAIERRPVLFQPLGTVEWHGRQNVVGLDTLKAYDLCIRAATEAGGLVAPPLYGGMGGLEQPFTFVMEQENLTDSVLLEPWLERLCSEAVRNGFKAVILLTGHYGASQQIIVRRAAVRMTQALHRPILGTPEYFLALDERYFGDHAAFFETSIMMCLRPDSVKLDELGEDPHQGVHGRDPKKYANPQDGKRIVDAIVRRLTALARQMPDWDVDTVERFAKAEETLLNAQLDLARKSGCIWEAWRNIDKGALSAYPEYLVSRRFEEITQLASQL